MSSPIKSPQSFVDAKTRIHELQQENRRLKTERAMEQMTLMELKAKVAFFERIHHREENVCSVKAKECAVDISCDDYMEVVDSSGETDGTQNRPGEESQDDTDSCDEENTGITKDNRESVEETPSLVNTYTIEDMEGDLQALSKVYEWSDEMETMREVQEKVRLLVWDLDRQRADLSEELQKHKAKITALEEENDLHEVKIDILTRTMREFIKEDPERWAVQGQSTESNSWFGFSFRPSIVRESPPTVALSDATSPTNSFDDQQTEGDISSNPFEEHEGDLSSKGSSHDEESDASSGGMPDDFPALQRQDDRLLAFAVNVKDPPPSSAFSLNPFNFEDCYIGDDSKAGMDTPLETIVEKVEEVEKEDVKEKSAGKPPRRSWSKRFVPWKGK